MYFPTATTKISTPLFFNAFALGMVKCGLTFEWPSVTRKTIFLEKTRRPVKNRKTYTVMLWNSRNNLTTKKEVYVSQLLLKVFPRSITSKTNDSQLYEHVRLVTTNAANLLGVNQKHYSKDSAKSSVRHSSGRSTDATYITENKYQIKGP